MAILFRSDLDGVDWEQLKLDLVADRFDNGRSPAQLEASFKNSRAVCLAQDGRTVVGTARALSDGVCNAYVVDVWTQSRYRRQGIATRMVEALLAAVSGQHVYLFTDDAVGFYKKLGFAERPTGLERIAGSWLLKT